MPFNGSGTFVSLAPPNFPAVPFTTILASMFNANMQDIFTNGLTKCLTRDGQSTPTANLPMAGFKFTGLGNGSSDTDSAALGQTLAARGLVGAIDWDTRTSLGIFEANAASLTTPSTNFPPTTSLGFLYVTAQGAIVDQLYVTSGLIYNRQKISGTWSFWALVSQINDNFLINGCFDFWDYATTQSTNGYGSDNRWINANLGTTKVHSRQSHTVGTTLGSTIPTFYSRTVVTSVAGAGNSCLKAQRIEKVATLQGQTATVSFYAKANTALPIAVSFTQNFGTGGSPSATVILSGQKVTLTTSFALYSLTFTIPSITGKTLGTAGDFLELDIWFDAGSNFNTQTNTLGQQSGTFDLFGIKVEAGQAATPLIPKTLTEEKAQCQRYYALVSATCRVYNYTATAATNGAPIGWPVEMRAVPALTQISAGTSSNITAGNLFTTTTFGGFFAIVAVPSIGETFRQDAIWSLNAEL